MHSLDPCDSSNENGADENEPVEHVAADREARSAFFF